MNKENEKVLKVLDEALAKYGTDILSVDLNCGMIDINLCNRHSSNVFFPVLQDIVRVTSLNWKVN